jgi:hypothetical protein
MGVTNAITQGFGFENSWADQDAGIRVQHQIMGRYDVTDYYLPGTVKGEVIGLVRHFRSSAIINQQPDGPNDLFDAMQQDEFGLRRYPARLAGCKLPLRFNIPFANQELGTQEVLTKHWAANWVGSRSVWWKCID